MKPNKNNHQSTNSTIIKAIFSHNSALGNVMDNRVKKEIISSLPKALATWRKMTKEIRAVEKNLSTPFAFSDEDKFYAVDPILISKAFGIADKGMENFYAAYSSYYLQVHLIDDLIEDPKKFVSKFKNSDIYSGELGMSSSLSVYLLNLVSSNFFEMAGLEKKRILELQKAISHSLLKQVKHFVLEKEDISHHDIIQVKEREVSGEATSMMAEILQFNRFFSADDLKSIKKGLYYLGFSSPIQR